MIEVSSFKSSTMDVALQLLDRLLLLFDHGLHEISDRDHAEHAATIHHWKMTDAALGHEAHAVLHGGVERDRNDWG